MSLKKKTLKKAISMVTALTTIVWLSGISMFAVSVNVASAAIADGALISSNETNSDGTPTLASLDVYIVKLVGAKKFKRLILNPQVFTSYQHFSWNSVQEVAQSVVDEYTTSNLVRVDGDASEKIYALAPSGDTGAKSWVNLTNTQFTTEAGADPDSVYTINSTDAGNYTAVGDVSTVSQLETFLSTGELPTVTPVPAGAVNVSLSAATPASVNVPLQSSVEFARIKLAAGSEAASITAIKVKASGLGTSTNIDEVTLYVDGSKVGTSKDINSDRVAQFNFTSPIELSANAIKELSIKATLAAEGTYALGINEAADVTTSGGSVTGSFPIVGNSMTANDTTAVGTVTLSSLSTTDTSNNFGEDNVLLAGFTLTTANEPVLWESARFRNGGTNVDGIVTNLRLVIDGVDVATADAPVNGNIDFAVNNYRIEKNDSVSVEVYGDLGVANVNNTVALYIKNRGDFAFVGEDYGYGVQLTAASYALFDTSTEGIIVTLTTGDVSLDMDKSATPAKDVKAGDKAVVLGTLKITSNGENATISQIVDSGADDFEIQGTGLGAGEIENVTMKDVATNAVSDVTATRVSDTEWTLSMTDEIALVKGVTKTFQIRADMSNTVGSEIDDGDTIKVVVGGTAMSITGDVSNAALTDITPSSVTSAIMTVRAASLDVTTTSLNSITVVPGASDVVIYQGSMKAGAADGIKLTSVVLTTNGAGIVDDFTDSNISKIDLYLNGVLIKSLSNNIVESAIGTPGSITFNSLITTGNANVVPAGKTVNLIAKATFASTLTSTAAFSLELHSSTTSIVARSVTGNEAVAENVTNVGTGSRTVTVAEKGTLKVELLTTNAKADKNTYILAGLASASDRYLAELKFTAANEPIIVQELRLENTGSSTNADVASVSLVDVNGVVKATEIPEVDGDVVFDPLNIEMPADQATSLFISITTRGINVDGDPSSTATHADTMIYNINATNGVVAQGKDSGETITLAVDTNGTVATGEWSAASVKSKTDTITGAVLNSISNTMTDGTLTGGAGKIIGKYTFVFNNGSNRTSDNTELKAIMDKLVITVNKSSAVVLTSVKAYIDGTTTKVTADTLATLGGGNTTGTATWDAGTLQALASSGKVDGSVTLIITADVTTTSSEYIQTSIADLNGTGGDDFNYIGDGQAAGTPFTNMYLGVDEVIGATLSNS